MRYASRHAAHGLHAPREGRLSPPAVQQAVRLVFTSPGCPATLTSAAALRTVGASAFDTATLAGGFNPTGTITFEVFKNDT